MTTFEANGGISQAPAPDLNYILDCAIRRERDATRRMQLGLRMGMEREGSTPAFKARQDAIIRARTRIRVRAITA